MTKTVPKITTFAIHQNYFIMQKVLFIAFMLLPMLVMAQAKPGKFRIQDGFFTKYEIGDTPATRKTVMEHLSKHDTDAAFYLERSRQNDISAYLWLGVAVAGAVAYAATDDDQIKWGGIGLMGLGGTAGLVMVLVSSNNQKKSQQHYNLKFGYR